MRISTNTKKITVMCIYTPDSFEVENGEELVEMYGSPAKILEDLLGHWTQTYIYPTRGLAFTLADVEPNVPLNEQRIVGKRFFVPMTLEEFEEVYGWESRRLPL